MSTAQTVKRSIAPQVEKKVINAIHIKKPNQKVSGSKQMLLSLYRAIYLL